MSETVEIVIKLHSDLYEMLKKHTGSFYGPVLSFCETIGYAIKDGVELPKGHSRLIDAHDLDLCIIARMINIGAIGTIPLKDLNDCIKNETKTILEADTSQNEVCSDNRFEIIAKAKDDIIKSTNIETNTDEMKVLDNILFRCWQMGWLDKYEESEEAKDE